MNTSSINRDRLAGLDLARSIAIFFMIIVNFKLIFDDRKGETNVLNHILDFIEGRAATLFVLIAGMGLTILVKRTSANSADASDRINWLIVKRSVLLLAMGWAFSFIWPLDILHFYGIYLIIGLMVYSCSERSIILLTLGSFLLFLVLMLSLKYEKFWLNSALPFSELLYIPDLVRHYLFEGVYPIIPWIMIFFAGMWLGRRINCSAATKKKALILSLVILVIVEIAAYTLYSCFTKVKYIPLTDQESISIKYIEDSNKKWLYVRPFPPTPFFILSSTANAFAVVIICMMTVERFKRKIWLRMLVNSGQLSLSIYIVHVIIGIVPLKYFGYDDNLSLKIIVLYSVLFFTVIVWLADLWKRSYGRGPFEWLVRILSNG